MLVHSVLGAKNACTSMDNLTADLTLLDATVGTITSTEHLLPEEVSYPTCHG
jgi:hypothetical protein